MGNTTAGKHSQLGTRQLRGLTGMYQTWCLLKRLQHSTKEISLSYWCQFRAHNHHHRTAAQHKHHLFGCVLVFKFKRIRTAAGLLLYIHILMCSTMGGGGAEPA